MSDPIELVTWNLNGLDDDALDERTEVAMFTILLGAPPEVALAGGPPRPPPDLVLLQEVVDRSLRAHIAPHLRAAGYQLFPTEPPDRGYYEVIAVRGRAVLGADVLRFPRSGQGRALLRVRLPGLTVFTAHLESLSAGAAVRLEQAAFALDQLRAAGPAVFGGDTNLRDPEWAKLDATGVRDAWEDAGSPRALRATWNTARYDRVWTAGGAACVGFERIGGTPLASTGCTPSDHLGVRVRISVDRGA